MQYIGISKLNFEQLSKAYRTTKFNLLYRVLKTCEFKQSIECRLIISPSYKPSKLQRPYAWETCDELIPHITI